MKQTEPDWKISRSRRLKRREDTEHFRQEVMSSEIDLFHPDYVRSALEADSLAQYNRLEAQEQQDVSNFLEFYMSYQSGSLVPRDEELLPLHESSLQAVAKHMLGNNDEASFAEQKFFLSFLLDRCVSVSDRELEVGLSAVLSYLKCTADTTATTSAAEQESLSGLCVQYVSNYLLRVGSSIDSDLEEIDFLEDLAQDLIDIPQKTSDLYAVIAMTKTKTARAYFESADTGLTPDDIQALSVMPEEYYRTGLSDEFDSLFYHNNDDDEYYEEDNYDDEYEAPLFEGEGLKVHDAWREGPFRIDFTPRGYASYSPQIRTEALLAGYHDFKILSERTDLHFSETDIFEGHTNREMAKAALLMGFKLIDEDDEYGQYVVQASYQDILQALGRLEHRKHNGESLLQKMQARVHKQHAREEEYDDQEDDWDEFEPSYG